ncbi:MAG: glycosyltransferase family 2 protein [Acidobacteria bacterium]|nr:glycosyltransferase family 2 protein [Acidobacteriota bacterium]
MPAPAVTVIIPNWNGEPHLPGLFRSLAGAAPDPRPAVLLVDNASDDRSLDLARQAPFPVNILELPENRGFASAVNAGIRASEAEYLVVLNTDTEWESDWISPCVGFLAANPGYAFTAPLVLGQARPDLIDGAGDGFNLRLMPLRRGFGRTLAALAPADRDLCAASGTAVVFRRSFFETTGLLDDDFFMYYEDADLFFRALLRGLKGRLITGARLRHREGGSIRRFEERAENRARRVTKTRLMLRNRVWMLLKNCPASYAAAFLPLLAFEAVRSFLYHLRRGEGTAFCRAHLDAVRRFPAVWRQRREVQRTRSIGLIGLVRRIRADRGGP